MKYKECGRGFSFFIPYKHERKRKKEISLFSIVQDTHKGHKLVIFSKCGF